VVRAAAALVLLFAGVREAVEEVER
jgi:hypothetical protein